MHLYNPPPFPTTGSFLKKMLHGAGPLVRASVAARLVRGELPYVNPTPAQAARVCRVTASRVHAALGHHPRQLSDVQIDRLIARAGADRVMQALDRYTRPKLPLVAAE